MTTRPHRRFAPALILVVVAALVTTVPASAAAAGCGEGVEGGRTGYVTHVGACQPPVSGSGSGPGQPTSSGGPHVVETFHQTECAMGQGGAQTCSGELALCDDGTVMTFVSYLMSDGSRLQGGSECPDDAIAPEVTPGLVLRALRRVPLPASELVVQPPGGRTLVNFDTNFYTEQGEFTRVVHLLGRRVELSIWPESFVWRYGDGSSERTSSAGAPYPDLEITHRYESKGRVAVSVDTTYAADFRVDGGPWREVAGTVTIPGESEALRVVTARPVLVGG